MHLRFIVFSVCSRNSRSVLEGVRRYESGSGHSDFFYNCILFTVVMGAYGGMALI